MPVILFSQRALVILVCGRRI